MQYPGYRNIFQCHVKLNYVNLMQMKIKAFPRNLVGPRQLSFSLNHKSCPFQLGIHFYETVQEKNKKVKEIRGSCLQYKNCCVGNSLCSRILVNSLGHGYFGPFSHRL